MAYTANDFSLATVTEADNVCVWDGVKAGHYEVWYLTCNHRKSRTGYWIRYTMEAPREGLGAAYAQLWFAHFHADDPSKTFAINRRFPIGQMVAAESPFSMSIGEARLAHDAARGKLEGNGHKVAWDLEWLPSPETYRQLPPVMYRRGGVGDTTVLTPNLDIAIRGTISVDGTTHTMEGEPGGQTHLWGKKHTQAWAWGHCNAFEGRRGAALEALTVRLKKRGFVLPPLTIFALYLDGEVFRWNRFAHTIATRGSWDTGRYNFSARGPRVRVEGEYSCRPEDMVVAEYEDPDGELSWCANTEVADLRVTVWKRQGLLGRWREHARLIAPKSGHFEVGGRERDAAVSKDHTTINVDVKPTSRSGRCIFAATKSQG